MSVERVSDFGVKLFSEVEDPDLSSEGNVTYLRGKPQSKQFFDKGMYNVLYTKAREQDLLPVDADELVHSIYTSALQDGNITLDGLIDRLYAHLNQVPPSDFETTHERIASSGIIPVISDDMWKSSFESSAPTQPYPSVDDCEGMPHENNIDSGETVAESGSHTDEISEATSDRMRKVIAARWNDPEQRQQAREHGKAVFQRLWADPEWRDKKIRQMQQSLQGTMPKNIDTFKHSRKGEKLADEVKDQMSLEKGGVRVKAFPLLLRNGTIEEITVITQLERVPIEKLRARLRKRGELPTPTQAEKKQARSRALTLRHLLEKQGGTYTDPQRVCIRQAQRFCDAGLITRDLTNWNDLQAIYQNSGRIAPSFFAEQINLEVFFEAVKQMNDQEGLMYFYSSIRTLSDPEFIHRGLSDEERFILETVRGEQREIKQSEGVILENMVNTTTASEESKGDEVPVEGHVDPGTESQELVESERTPERDIENWLESHGYKNIDTALEMIEYEHRNAMIERIIIIVKNKEDALEVYQDILYEISSKPDKRLSDDPHDLRANLMKMCSSRSIDLLRMKRRRPEGHLIDFDASNSSETNATLHSDLQSKINRVIDKNRPIPSAEDEVLEIEKKQVVHDAIGQLPIKQQEVVLLQVHGYSQSEIAEGLSRPLGTIKTQGRLGLEKLRRILGPHERELLAY